MRKNNMYQDFDHGKKHLKEYQRWLAPSGSRHFTKNAVFSEAG